MYGYIYRNVTISIPLHIGTRTAKKLVERAAAREDGLLQQAIAERLKGRNYQYTDELARRAFAEELHLEELK